MARKKFKTAKLDRENYEKALLEYFDARNAYRDDQNPKTRRVWQESVLKTLQQYSRAVNIMQWTQDIPLDWQFLLDLKEAMQAVIDGKDPELFHVDPSDSYDSHMRFAKEVAVAYVGFGKDKKDTQERKLWIMENYSVSRSTLNEWIRLIDASHLDDEELFDLFSIHSGMADDYRENKLIARRRKR